MLPQTLSTERLSSRYVSNIDKIIDEAPKDPTQDFKTQV